MMEYSNSSSPEAIFIEFETYPQARSRFIAEIEDASILTGDGRVLTGQLLVGHGAIAGVMQRQLRDQVGPYRGIVVQRDGYLEMEAIWDDDRLIDGDGVDIAEAFKSNDTI